MAMSLANSVAPSKNCVNGTANIFLLVSKQEKLLKLSSNSFRYHCEWNWPCAFQREVSFGKRDSYCYELWAIENVYFTAYLL